VSDLEADAGDKTRFVERVKAVAPAYAVDDDLRSFCQSDIKLGEVMERLIHFEPAAETPQARR